MDAAPPCRLAHHLAARLRAQRDELTRRWLDRIAARVTLDPNRIFPTDDLLNHVPVLIDAVADYPEDPTEEVATDAPAVAKAIELGELRFAQGFDTAEILKEFEILGGILFHFLVTQVDSIDEPCSRSELLACAHRLFRTLAVIQYVTTTHFLQKVGAQVAERENRLRRFNRLVSHELKNHIHTARGALEALAELGPDAPEAAKFVDMARRHLKRMGETLEDLLELTRLADDPRRHRNVELPEAVAEAVRQVREAAQAQGIEIRLAEDLPRVEVHAAAVELCLTNYLSNAQVRRPCQVGAVDRRARMDRSQRGERPRACRRRARQRSRCARGGARSTLPTLRTGPRGVRRHGPRPQPGARDGRVVRWSGLGRTSRRRHHLPPGPALPSHRRPRRSRLTSQLAARGPRL